MENTKIAIRKTLNAYSVMFDTESRQSDEIVRKIQASGFQVAEKRENYFSGTTTLIVNDNEDYGHEELARSLKSIIINP